MVRKILSLSVVLCFAVGLALAADPLVTIAGGAQKTVKAATLQSLGASPFWPVSGALTYNWTVTAGPASVLFENGTRTTGDSPFVNARLPVPPDAENRDVVLTLTVTGGGLTTTATQTLLVRGRNQAPEARITSGYPVEFPIVNGIIQDIPGGYAFSLDASTSTDQDGDAIGYEWYVKSASQSMVLFAAAFPQVHFTIPFGPGTYVIEVHAADDFNLNKTSVTLVVIGAPGGGPGGTPVTPPGGSTPPPVSITYTAANVGGPEPSNNQRPNISGITGRIDVDEGQTVAFTVTAADPDFNNANYPGAGGGGGGLFGIPGSGAGGGGGNTSTSVLTYQWTARRLDNNTSVALTGATTSVASLVAPEVAANTNIEMKVEVKDPLNLGTSATFIVTVKNLDSTSGPTAFAGANRTVQPGAYVTMDDATATGFNASQVQYSWAKASGQFDVVFSSSVNSSATQAILKTTVRIPANAAAGSLVTLRLTVSDNSATRSSTVKLTVAGATGGGGGGTSPAVQTTKTNEGDVQTGVSNQRPTISSVNGEVTVNERKSVSWTVTAADPDPTNPAYTGGGSGGLFGIPGVGAGGGSTATPTSVLTYSWTAQTTVSGTQVPLQNDKTATATLVAGNVNADSLVIITVVVTDPLGLGTKATFQATIKDVNKAPVSKIKKPVAAVKSGVKDVVLDGKQSVDGDSDSEDGALLYQWEQTAGTPVTLKDATKDVAKFDAPANLTVNTELTFKLTVRDTFDTGTSDTVTVLVQPINLAVLIPLLESKSTQQPSGLTLNSTLGTALVLMYPPSGTAPPSPATVRFRARSENGSVQENLPADDDTLYWGQQRGYFGDLLYEKIFKGVAANQKFAPASLEALGTGGILKGFFLLYSRQPTEFGNMDGVTSDFKLGNRLILPGLRYKRGATGVARQSHVFLYNPNPSLLPVTVTMVQSQPDGKFFTRTSSSLRELKANAAVFQSIDTLFPSFTSENPGFELDRTSHLVVAAASDIQGMIAFEDGADSISTVKAIVPLGLSAFGEGAARKIYAPFITVSPKARKGAERYDSVLTLYNADLNYDALLKIRAFSPGGNRLFPVYEREIALKAASQVTLPVLNDGTNGGLFTEDVADAALEAKNGYLEIVADKKASIFGPPQGSQDVHGFVSTKFPGSNETSIPLTADGLNEAYFLHVAHNPGQGDFRTALAILNLSATQDTTIRVEFFVPNSANTAEDRAKLGTTPYFKDHLLAVGQQLTQFIDQLVPGVPSYNGGFVRIKALNPAVKLATFCTYFVLDSSKGGLWSHALSSIDPVEK
ncbi:MAG: PKD domain-containing protein [Acidobacteriota bacterium]